MFWKIYRKTPVVGFYFSEVAGLQPVTLLKQDSVTGLFLWAFRLFPEQLLTEHLWTAASGSRNWVIFWKNSCFEKIFRITLDKIVRQKLKTREKYVIQWTCLFLVGLKSNESENKMMTFSKNLEFFSPKSTSKYACSTLSSCWIAFLQSSCVTFFRAYSEALVRRCSSKQVFLKISKISQENTCVRVSFNKVAGLGRQLY